MRLFHNRNRQMHSSTTVNTLSNSKPDYSRIPLVSHLDDNILLLQSVLDRVVDIVMTSFVLYDKRSAKLIYIEGLSSSIEIDAHLMQPLIQTINRKFDEREKNANIERLAKEYISISEWKHIEPTCKTRYGPSS